MRDWEGVLPDPFTEGPGSWASIVAADDVAGLLAAPEGVPTPLDVGAEAYDFLRRPVRIAHTVRFASGEAFAALSISHLSPFAARAAVAVSCM